MSVKILYDELSTLEAEWDKLDERSYDLEFELKLIRDEMRQLTERIGNINNAILIAENPPEL